MKELVAKKYVKALLQVCDKEELNAIITALENVSLAFSVDNFQSIIESPDVAKDKKVELILSVANHQDNKFINLIHLLSEKDRLLNIPLIHKELESQVALKENIFEGSVVGDWDISSEQITHLEESFGKKFGANIKLKSQKNEYPGIKIALDSLGVEASFSLDRLKAQIANHILKAI